MTKLDYYLTQDHAARQRTMLISVSVGALAGMLAELLGAAFNVAVVVCVLTVGGLEIIRAVSYAPPVRKIIQSSADFQETRRYLLGLVYSAVGCLAVAFWASPRVEAMVERKLREATAGDPPYDKANKLIKSALQNDIRINSATVEIVRRKVAGTHSRVTGDVQASVNLTLAQLDAYQIYVLTGIKLNVVPRAVFLSAYTYSVNDTIRVNWGPNIGEDRSRATINAVDFNRAQSPAIFSYEGGGSRDAFVSHLTATSTMSGGAFVPPAFIQRDSSPSKLAVFDVTVLNLSQALDDIIWVNVTFDRCRINYQGGRLQLKWVTFKDCQFNSENESARAILDRIRQQGTNSMTWGIP